MTTSIAVNHIPVLLKETLEALQVKPGGRYIDCTLGAGGHAAAILQASSPGGQLLGIDADPKAIQVAQAKLEPFGKAAILVNDNFAHLEEICSRYDFCPVDGILFDLGLSSLQLNGNDRGFSFQRNNPLDMRFDPRQQLTAAQIVNTYSEEKLSQIIAVYGEERYHRLIARRIVHSRPVTSSLELARILAQAVPGSRARIHPATRTFQALRIAVNSELETLDRALRQTPNILFGGGRLVVISYHSLEDRIVKGFMWRESHECLCPPGTPVCICGHTPSLKLVNKKIIVPSASEVKANPRSRSARMRVAERI